jgi:hypothetical protein
MTQFEHSLNELGSACQEYDVLLKEEKIGWENVLKFQTLQQKVIDKAMSLCFGPDWKKTKQDDAPKG